MKTSSQDTAIEVKIKLTESADAALKIQKFWRTHSFFSRFLALQAASPLEIQQGCHDVIFNYLMRYCLAKANQFELHILPETKTLSPSPVVETKKNRVVLLSADPDDRNKLRIWLQRNNQISDKTQTVIALSESIALGFTAEESKLLTTWVSAKDSQRIVRIDQPVLLDKIIALCGYDSHVKSSLKMIAHALFTRDKSGEYSIKDVGHFKDLLLHLFADKKSVVVDIIEILISVHTAIRSALEDKSNPQLEDKPTDKFDLAKRKAELTATGEETYWGEKSGVKKNDIVTIVHWGGLQCIRNLLYGRRPGYRLENSMGLGLQVSPIKGEIPLEEVHKHSLFRIYSGSNYAIKAQANFDIHARFFAYVEAQYILPASNGYEGGFPAVNVRHLKDVAIYALYSLDPEAEYLFNYGVRKSYLLSPYLEQSLFYQRCERTVDKLYELNRKQRCQVDTVIRPSLDIELEQAYNRELRVAGQACIGLQELIQELVKNIFDKPKILPLIVDYLLGAEESPQRQAKPFRFVMSNQGGITIWRPISVRPDSGLSSCQVSVALAS